MLQAKGETHPPGGERPDARPVARDEGYAPREALSGRATNQLPFEPATGEPGDPAIDPNRLAGQLRRFYRHGRRPAGAPAVAAECWPALLWPYLNLSRIRYQYPLCILDCDHPPVPSRVAEPLTAIGDRVLNDIGLEGDPAERLRRHLHQLEAAFRGLAEQQPGARLIALWEQAAAHLAATSGLTGEKQEQLRQDLSLVQDALKVDGEILPCGPSAPRRLFEAVLLAHWSEFGRPRRRQLDELIIGLEDMLRADFDHSPQARSPEHLQGSLGRPAAEDMDFGKMSELLSQAHLDAPLPPARRQRLEQALATLRTMLPLFDGAALSPGAQTALPVPLTPLTGFSGVAERQQLRKRALVDFWRAARIAELEIANRYRGPVHDDYFAAFGHTDLSAEEASALPPQVMYLSQQSLSGGNGQALLELLGSGEPFKVVVTLNDLLAEDPDGQPFTPHWTARLPLLALAENQTFVLQCSAARPALLQTGFSEGLRYPGAALFAVYAGGEQHVRLPAYLDAAAAADCRAFPAFRFDPGGGETLAERMALLGDSRQADPWPREAFRYLAADGTEIQTERAFTYADFLFCERRLAACFWALPASLWVADMVPLEEFLKLDSEPVEAGLPYLSAVSADGELVRVAVSATIVAAVRRCASRWRALQESAGINNSFARALLDEERQRLAGELERQAARLEGEHQRLLDRQLGELTHEIVARIAGQLLAGEASPRQLTGAAHAPALPAEAPPEVEAGPADEAAPPAPAEPDDDEELALDDPYIDTPLCTSCDDCTNMSPRIFAYDDNKQAYIKDAGAGTYRELVLAAEKCPVKIIHPGKPVNPDEPQLQEWIERASNLSGLGDRGDSHETE